MLGAPTEIAAAAANRSLLGLVIAIGGWRIPHLPHGAVLGFLVSVSVPVGFTTNQLPDFVAYTTAGTLYGLFIEYLSTNFFHASMRSRCRI